MEVKTGIVYRVDKNLRAFSVDFESDIFFSGVLVGGEKTLDYNKIDRAKLLQIQSKRHAAVQSFEQSIRNGLLCRIARSPRICSTLDFLDSSVRSSIWDCSLLSAI